MGKVMHEYVIGIDPGANGGIAICDRQGDLVSVSKLCGDYQSVAEMIKKLPKDSVCYMEKVGYGMPGQSSVATATFARHVGCLETALYMSGISTVMVSPGKWEKDMGLLSKKGESKTMHKTRIKVEAQRRFASIRVALWGADALMICSWGVEQERQEAQRQEMAQWDVHQKMSDVPGISERAKSAQSELMSESGKQKI
jgi:hypothetical protein